MDPTNALHLLVAYDKQKPRTEIALALMPQADAKLERLLAQCANGALHLLGNIVDRRPGLRVLPQLSLHSLRPGNLLPLHFVRHLLLRIESGFCLLPVQG
jgi:hypothetical protein